MMTGITIKKRALMALAAVFAAICLLKAGRRADAVFSLKSLASMGREGNPSDEKFKTKGQNLLKVIEKVKEL